MSQTGSNEPRRGTRRRALYGLGASLAAVGATFAATGTDNTASAHTSSGYQQAVVNGVKGQQGKPFEEGANGPSAFDCSSLAQYVYKRAGINLPRTSQAQYHTGQAVSRTSIRPGDLVFFSTDGGGPTHVGIAVSSTKVVSATTHGVREHSISGSYWGSHYVGARREG
jgi:cell wall-associated NlpC family hydrolase